MTTEQDRSIKKYKGETGKNSPSKPHIDPLRYVLAACVVACILIVVWGAMRWSENYVKKQAQDDFNTFDSTAINGVLAYVGIAHHKMEFWVNTNEKHFIFNPSAGGKNDFYFLAKKGDSIVKPAFADHLLLIKGNKPYSIIFERP